MTIESFKITIPALRDKELIALYKEIYLLKDKRKGEIEEQFKIRLLDRDKVIQELINEGPRDPNDTPNEPR